MKPSLFLSNKLPREAVEASSLGSAKTQLFPGATCSSWAAWSSDVGPDDLSDEGVSNLNHLLFNGLSTPWRKGED